MKRRRPSSQLSRRSRHNPPRLSPNQTSRANDQANGANVQTETTTSSRAMALSSKQRNALPASAFAYPAARKYPVPTKTQAASAGISEAQRLRVHRSALSYAARADTTGSYKHVAKAVKARSGGKITPARKR